MRPFRPTLFCEKNSGPGDSNLIIGPRTIVTTAVISNPTIPPRISIKRFSTIICNGISLCANVIVGYLPIRLRYLLPLSTSNSYKLIFKSTVIPISSNRCTNS